MIRPEVDFTDSTSILVVWEAPLGLDPVSFDVRAIDQSTFNDYICKTKRTDTRFIFDQLTPGHCYRFMVKPLYCDRAREEGEVYSDPSKVI